MATCKECIHYDACKGTLDVVGLDIAAECPNQELLCGNFMGRNLSKNPMTNADRIRDMSDEELAKTFETDFATCPPNAGEDKWCDKDADCKQCWLDWLKQPAE